MTTPNDTTVIIAKSRLNPNFATTRPPTQIGASSTDEVSSSLSGLQPPPRPIFMRTPTEQASSTTIPQREPPRPTQTALAIHPRTLDELRREQEHARRFYAFLKHVSSYAGLRGSIDSFLRHVDADLLLAKLARLNDSTSDITALRRGMAEAMHAAVREPSDRRQSFADVSTMHVQQLAVQQPIGEDIQERPRETLPGIRKRKRDALIELQNALLDRPPDDVRQRLAQKYADASLEEELEMRRMQLEAEDARQQGGLVQATVDDVALGLVRDAFNSINADGRLSGLEPGDFLDNEFLSTHFAEYVGTMLKIRRFTADGRDPQYYRHELELLQFLREQCFATVTPKTAEELQKTPQGGRLRFGPGNEDTYWQKRNAFDEPERAVRGPKRGSSYKR